MTTTASPGDVVLNRVGAGSEVTGRLYQPSFETYGWSVSRNLIYLLCEAPCTSGWHSAGAAGCRMYNDARYTISAGRWVKAVQTANLSGITTIKFDAKLSSSGVTAGVFKAVFLIDGVEKWSKTAYATYLNQAIDVSSLAVGRHILELRMEAVSTFAGGANAYVEWDNFRAYAPSGYATSGTVTTSAAITPAALGKWGALSFTTAMPASTTVTVDVLDGSGTTLLANVASGTDLNTAGITAASLKLRANLATSNTANTPTLSDWSVAYQAPDVAVTGDWSNVVYSTQTGTDPAPLILSGPKVTKITRTAAVINWNTNVPSSSLLGFDTVSRESYGLYATFTHGPGGLTNHSVKLAGLVPNTRYYLRVRSVDGYGRSVDSGEISFTTANLPPTHPDLHRRHQRHQHTR